MRLFHRKRNPSQPAPSPVLATAPLPELPKGNRSVALGPLTMMPRSSLYRPSGSETSEMT